MNTMHTELRRHPRVRHHMPLTVSSLRLRVFAGPGEDASMVDISRGGVRVRSQAPLQTGRQVVLRLRSRALRRVMRYRGQVVWSRPADGDSGASWVTGIRFSKQGADERMLVYRLVTGNGSA